MDVNRRIQKFRKEKGISQKQLAKMTGLSIASIQGYEQGKYLPKHDKLQKIAAALGISLLDLDPNAYMPTVIHVDYGNEHKEYITGHGSEGNDKIKPLDSEMHNTRQINIARIELNEDFLNDTGIKKLADYSFDLVQSGNYKRDT